MAPGYAPEKPHRAVHIFRCPICREGMHMDGNASIVCEKGHCFDIAKKGYINFAGGKGSQSYGKELFLHRRRVLAGGFYEGVLREIEAAVSMHCAGKDGTCILDAGCGEGYYTKGLALSDALRGCLFFGCDLSREAVSLAAKRDDGICWMVADIADIPLKDKSMDVILDILTPANYSEFLRLLKDGGMVIKIIPAEGYLKEIRGAIAGQLKTRQTAGEQAALHMAAHVDILYEKRITYTCAVNEEQRNDFLRMTPMTQSIDWDKADWEGIGQVTIDLWMIAGQKR